MGRRNEGIRGDGVSGQSSEGTTTLCRLCAAIRAGGRPTGRESATKGRLRYQSAEVVGHAELGAWTAGQVPASVAWGGNVVV